MLKIANYVVSGKTALLLEVPTFAIAKYPVTNAQFAFFIEAGGYQQQQWWSTDGWHARQEQDWTEPHYWQESEWNSADQPVVGVSWYEAMAYCRWLSDAAGESISLPTEQQWQRAAQGDDSRTYPWGKEWEGQRCNNSVEPPFPDSTTPVTAYQGLDKGDSPFRVADMVGNVWEWCSTVFETNSPDYAERDFRVIRGSAWDYDDIEEFSVENRGRQDALDRTFSVGLRLVRSL